MKSQTYRSSLITVKFNEVVIFITTKPYLFNIIVIAIKFSSLKLKSWKGWNSPTYIFDYVPDSSDLINEVDTC